MAIRKSSIDDREPTSGQRVDPAALGERYHVRGRFRRRSGAPVLLAVDEVDGQLVAIKTSGDPETARAEADVLAALDHPSIVRLRDRLEVDHEVWLVLDYIAGDSVETRLQTAGAMAPDVVTGLLSKLADTLSHVHERGFLHRDLKPANVLIRPEGGLAIIDFGAARPIEGGIHSDSQSVLSHGYAAPEQYLADAAEGPWTDVYALGAFGYRALTGEAPPPAPDRLDHGALLELPALEKAPALRAALTEALQLDADRRPPSPAAFLALLDAGPSPLPPADDDGEGTPTIRITRRPGRRAQRREEPVAELPPARRRRVFPIVLLLALIGAVAGGAYAAWPLYQRYFKATWLVDPSGGGDVATIGEALERAKEGARIVIRPGTYDESLVLGRAAHLIAEEGGERPVIAPSAGPCLLTTASGASIEGLALEGSETAGVACLAISGGDISVRDSLISAEAGPSLEVRAGATPEISGTEISGTGVVIREGAQPLLSEVTISGVEGPSVIVRSGALPELIGNHILQSGPIVFAEGSSGLLESNDVREALGNAVEVASGAAPAIRDNEILEAGEAGVYVYGDGDGQIEGNRIIDSALSAVVVDEGSSASVAGNQVEGSGEHGILVLGGAKALIEDNVIQGSTGRGIAIAPDAEAELGENDFVDNRSGAVLDARPGAPSGGDDGSS